jgi:hypothetical protein
MTPHWGGAWAALVGTILLLGWLFTARRLGTRRWVIAAVMQPQLVLLALIANGTQGVQVTGFTTLEAPSPLADTWLQRAVETTTSPEFMSYAARLDPPGAAAEAQGVRDHLQVHFMSTADLARQGLVTASHLQGKRLCYYEYVDRQNAFFPLFGIGVEAFQARAAYARLAVLEYLEELFWLEACRAATTEVERIAALEALVRHGVPMPAEWVLRELERLEKASGPTGVAAFARARTWAQRYVDGPELRGLPGGSRIPL